MVCNHVENKTQTAFGRSLWFLISSSLLTSPLVLSSRTTSPPHWASVCSPQVPDSCWPLFLHLTGKPFPRPFCSLAPCLLCRMLTPQRECLLLEGRDQRVWWSHDSSKPSTESGTEHTNVLVQWMNEASQVLVHVPPTEFNRIGFISPRLAQATLSQIATVLQSPFRSVPAFPRSPSQLGAVGLSSVITSFCNLPVPLECTLALTFVPYPL